ncbi:MAG: hypothetical protein FJX75_27005 [Armatimonadetes bacterium]|nr:hypothetical protein [Armatimonadota bacterium]
MQPRVPLVSLAVAHAVVLASARPALAIPVFARQYDFRCVSCHDPFPRLNDFGERFRVDGYRLPWPEENEKTAFEGQVPVSVRANVGLRGPSDWEPGTQLGLQRVDILSAGWLGRNVSYFAAWTPGIGDDAWYWNEPDKFEVANVLFTDVDSTGLDVRFGRFEPAYITASGRRSLSWAPYEIYDYAFPAGPSASDTRDGVEVTGRSDLGFSYALGWLDGRSYNGDRMPFECYCHLATVFGEGEGQTSGQRLGFTAYLGHVEPRRPWWVSTATLQRFGVDLAFNVSDWHLSGQGIWARDGGLSYWQINEFRGGYLEADYLPGTRTSAFTRYDWVDDGGKNTERFTIGGRYNVQDNLALHVQYSCADYPCWGCEDYGHDSRWIAALDWAF